MHNSMEARPTRVVYTVIVGAYDGLKDLPALCSGIRCICFTDNKELKARGWEMKLLPRVDPEKRSLINRDYKFLPFLYFEADQSLYVDGNIQLVSDPSELFEKYLSDVDIAIPKHSLRNCAYDEIEECFRQGIIDDNSGSIIRKVLTDDAFPRNYGLYENNIIFRNHNASKLRNAMEMWYSLYKDYARRDQLSLTYCLWKHRVKVKAVTEGPRYSGKYFKMHLHNHHMNLPLLKQLRHRVRINSKRNYVFGLIDYLIGCIEKVAFR
jgi:hypothetical protein